MQANFGLVRTKQPRYVVRMKLTDHLRAEKQSPHRWAKDKGVPKDAVYRHLSGKPIDYENAKRISGATAGAVSVLEIMEPPATTNEGLSNGDAS